MADLFLKILNTSIAAGWFVLAVVVLRLVLKKAPKWIHVLLWGMVALRLLLPFSIKSALSLIPSAETVPPDIMLDTTPAISTGIHALNSAVNPVISQTFAPVPGESANPLQIWVNLAAVVWLMGVAVMLCYTAFSYWRLHRKVATAIRERDNIFRSEYVVSPFVLGLLRPSIYLPADMMPRDADHVIAHERSHIRRKDHWWKPLGFLLLAIHWFNPLMWLAYILLCRDIEMACDEKVIKELGSDQRADYSQALLSCSISRRSIAACPLAFGEVGVKERVKNVLNYKKPAFWIILVAIVACITAAVCFLTDPPKEPPTEDSEIKVTVPAVTIWYEYDDPNYSQNTQWQLDAFPGVTFRFDPTCSQLFVIAEDKEIEIPTSSWVHNIYVADLNGDGYPEICTDGIFPSLTAIANYGCSMVVYDYANNVSYTVGNTSSSTLPGLAYPSISISGLVQHAFLYGAKYAYSLRVKNGVLICDKKNEWTDEQVLATGLLSFVDTADGNMLYLAPLPDALKPAEPQVYIFGEDGKLEEACLTLRDDGTFTFSSSLLSSYIGIGTYTISDKTLTALTNGGIDTYVFTIVEEGMRFEAEQSSDLSHVSGLYDGAILYRKNTAQ